MSTLDCDGIHQRGHSERTGRHHGAPLDQGRLQELRHIERAAARDAIKLVQAALQQEQPQQHAHPVTTVRPLARRPSQPSPGPTGVRDRLFNNQNQPTIRQSP